MFVDDAKPIFRSRVLENLAFAKTGRVDNFFSHLNKKLISSRLEKKKIYPFDPRCFVHASTQNIVFFSDFRVFFFPNQRISPDGFLPTHGFPKYYTTARTTSYGSSLQPVSVATRPADRLRTTVGRAKALPRSPTPMIPSGPRERDNFSAAVSPPPPWDCGGQTTTRTTTTRPASSQQTLRGGDEGRSRAALFPCANAYARDQFRRAAAAAYCCRIMWRV